MSNNDQHSVPYQIGQVAGGTSEREQAAWIIAGFGVLLSLVFGFLWWNKPTPNVENKVVQQPVYIETKPKKPDVSMKELLNLKSIQVGIDNSNSKFPLPVDRLKNKIELTFRNAGISLDEKAMTPQLVFEAGIVDNSTGTKSLSIHSYLLELAELHERSAPIQTVVRSYEHDDLLIIGSQRDILKDVEDHFIEHAERFANQYLAANPKK